MPDQLLQWVELGSEPGVAPGSLEHVRALLNTDDRFHGVDRLAGAPAGLVAFGAGAATLEPAGGDAVVAGLLADVHRSHAAGEWTRLKACANPDCQWVYYDGSRNRSGRWCSMNECGDVMKARAYRRRVRQA